VRGWAQRAWDSWLDWASRSRLEPMVKVAKMIRYHLIGILNADVLNVTNRSVGAQHFREVGHPP
jgi:transposase